MNNNSIKKADNLKSFRADKMRYQKNNFSYFLILLGLVISIVAMFLIVNKIHFTEKLDNKFAFSLYILTAVEILIGIISMLLTFLCAEKVKSYSPFWSTKAVFVLPVINFVRIFLVPLNVFMIYKRLTLSVVDGGTTTVVKPFTAVTFLLPVLLYLGTCAIYIVAGVVASRKTKQLLIHINELKEAGKNYV
jgi:hypothetical protein